jgi:hypothetical protein
MSAKNVGGFARRRRDRRRRFNNGFTRGERRYMLFVKLENDDRWSGTFYNSLVVSKHVARCHGWETPGTGCHS